MVVVMRLELNRQSIIGYLTIILCFPIYTSIQRIIPVSVGFVMMGACLLLMMLSNRSNTTYYPRGTFSYFCFILVILAILIFNNNRIKVGNYDYTLYFMLMAMACIILPQLQGWTHSVFSFFVVVSVIHIICNWIFYMNSNIYTGFVARVFPDYTSELLFNYSQGSYCGLTVHYTQNAMYLAVAFGVFFCKAIENDIYRTVNGRKKYMFLCLLVLVFFLIMSKRGPFIFSVFSAVVIYLLSRTESFGKTLLTVVLSTILIICGYYLLAEYLPDSVNTISRIIDSSKNSDTILNGRGEYFEYALSVWRNQPITGVGLGGTYLIHNCYLQILAEYGLVGFICYISFFLHNIIQTLRMINQTKNSIFYNKYNVYLNFSLYFQLFFVLFCATENPLYEVIMVCPYFISIAILMWYQNNWFIYEWEEV